MRDVLQDVSMARTIKGPGLPVGSILLDSDKPLSVIDGGKKKENKTHVLILILLFF